MANDLSSHVTHVSSDMRTAFYDLLLNPPEPSAALRKLAAPTDVEWAAFYKQLARVAIVKNRR